MPIASRQYGVPSCLLVRRWEQRQEGRGQVGLGMQQSPWAKRGRRQAALQVGAPEEWLQQVSGAPIFCYTTLPCRTAV